MNKILIISLLVISFSLKSQDYGWKKLGSAEKVWVILHPFSAKKAQRLSFKTLQVVDSLKPALYEKFNGSGSKLDAFRHGYWMSLLSARIGPRRALWLGRAHEKKNKDDYKKRKLEDGDFVDEMTIEMDLLNNKFGVKVGKNCYKCSDQKLANTIIDALKTGELKIIRHNYNGEFLDEKNQIIKENDWNNKFENQRNLVPSNFRL